MKIKHSLALPLYDKVQLPISSASCCNKERIRQKFQSILYCFNLRKARSRFFTDGTAPQRGFAHDLCGCVRQITVLLYEMMLRIL